MRAVCFLSDYGYADDFAGTCRGVIKRLAPDVHVIDISHGIARHDVLGGAFVLRNTLPYMPDGAVHLAVVDPMVGWQRRAVALRSASDRVFVGPDNGLLTLAATADGGVVGGARADQRGSLAADRSRRPSTVATSSRRWRRVWRPACPSRRPAARSTPPRS